MLTGQHRNVTYNLSFEVRAGQKMGLKHRNYTLKVFQKYNVKDSRCLKDWVLTKTEAANRYYTALSPTGQGFLCELNWTN